MLTRVRWAVWIFNSNFAIKKCIFKSLVTHLTQEQKRKDGATYRPIAAERYDYINPCKCAAPVLLYYTAVVNINGIIITYGRVQLYSCTYLWGGKCCTCTCYRRAGAYPMQYY